MLEGGRGLCYMKNMYGVENYVEFFSYLDVFELETSYSGISYFFLNRDFLFHGYNLHAVEHLPLKKHE